MKKYNFPNKKGYFGQFGGRFVPPALEMILERLTETYNKLKNDKKFKQDLIYLYKEYAGRPSNLYFAKNLTKKTGGAKIYLKREDLNHTGAHKINNTIGQGLVAKYLGKKKLIAETGAGQHGLATATIACYFNMVCDIYMGVRDIEAEKPNVYKMKVLGARVIPVSQGQGTLKDAVDAALTAYIKEPDSYYLLGSVVGPHPYPMMVRDFQKIIGEEIKKQILKKEAKLPDYIVTCVGGGSNSIGAFYNFLLDEKVHLIAVEPAGMGKKTGKHGLALGTGKQGVLHGFKTLLMQNNKGEVKESYSAASGLDYPGVGPELSYLKEVGRLELAEITDKEAVESFIELSKTEGIIPALESAHAIAYAIKLAKKLTKDKIIVVNLSGRGDKDVENIYEKLIYITQ